MSARYGAGGATGRRIVEKKDDDRRRSGGRAAVGAGLGAAAAHAPLSAGGAYLSGVVQGNYKGKDAQGLPEYLSRGERAARDAKEFVAGYSPKRVGSFVRHTPKYAAVLAGGAAAGAAIGGRKRPVTKADWMGIEEHKRRARDSRRTKTTGNVLGATGLAGAGLVVGNYPGSARELRDISRTARGRVTPQRLGEEQHEFSVRDRSSKMTAGAGQRARNVVRSAKVRPGGAALGGSLALAGLGVGTYAAGRLNENRHDRAVSRIRRQRSSAVGKAVSLKGAKGFLRETKDELKQTFRPLSAADRMGGRAIQGSPLRVRAAETILTRPKASAALGTGAYLGVYNLGNAAGGMRGRRSAMRDVDKRYRDYNDEHRRQRRIGMAEAAAIGGGGTALGFGGHGAYKDTKALRDLDLRDIKGRTSTKLGKTPVGRNAIVLGRKNGALLLAGGAGLAGAAGLRRWAEGNRGRAYS